MTETPALYDDLADWWPLLSPPEEYAAEAAEYLRLMRGAADGPLDEVLELGSGGGNNASHLKRDLRMTLVDCSPGMLAVSRALNPECEHLEGDMRSVRIGRTFDPVFIHDAIAYMTSNGGGTTIRPTTLTSRTSRTCSGCRTARWTSGETGTSAACSRGGRGCGCWSKLAWRPRPCPSAPRRASRSAARRSSVAGPGSDGTLDLWS